MKCTRFFCAALTATCLYLSSSAMAAIIVNDTWLDGNDTDPASPTDSENGVDTDLDGDIESIWYRGGGGTLDPVGPGGPLRGTGFAGSSASWTSYFTPEISPITLSNVGDSIRVTWVFTTGDVNASNTSQNFRFALIDSATRLTANGSPSGNATGYAIFGNMGETLGHNDSFELVQRIGQSAILGTGSDWSTSAPLGDAGTNGNAGYVDNTQYTMEWTITRNANSNHDIVVSMSGPNLDGTGNMTASALDVVPNGGSHSFDTFTLRPSNAGTTSDTFDTSLFRVEYLSVPEPASLALFGLSALAVVLRRQR
jgi:hypothetical protein